MAKLIDKDAVMNTLRKIQVIQSMDIVQEVAFAEGVDVAIAVVDVSPTVDAVEVVRCKDCKRSSEIPLIGNSLYCSYWDICTSDDGFCYKGGKKDAVD